MPKFALHALLVATLASLSATPAVASPDLARQKLCLNCHAVDKAVVGPAFKEVAVRYAGQKDAAALLATRIQKGSEPGKLNWGMRQVPMPANGQVSAEDAKKLADWVLSVK